MRFMKAAHCVSICSLHSPTLPTPTGWIVGSTLRMASTTRLCFFTYSSSGMLPSCQLPYISLPTANHFTPNGSGWPFCGAQLAQRRRRPSR